MNRDEAIKELTDLLPEEFLSEYADAIKMAIKALEQQPTDAVSRQAAIVALDDRMSSLENVDMQIAMGFAKGIIHELPPVTPQPKMGKWIDGKCNKCGREALHWELTSSHYYSEYCPYCGADMQDHCKDCEYFENEICKRWGNGYKTKEDGSCFIFEPKMQEVEE